MNCPRTIGLKDNETLELKCCCKDDEIGSSLRKESVEEFTVIMRRFCRKQGLQNSMKN